MEITPEKVDVPQLLKELEDKYKPKAEASGLVFKLATPENVPEIISNSYRLKEVLANLLDNALKYTESGSVTLGAERVDGRIRFYIVDTGMGIKKSDQKHIFERFWRSEDYQTRTHSGTGLGLYLTKRIVERLKGKITFSSQLGKGTTFTVTIPERISQ